MARPPTRGALRLRFQGVPLSARISGFAGLSYFLYRDGGRKPVEIVASVGDAVLGSHRHEDAQGWRAFSFDTSGYAGRTVDLDLTLRAAPGEARTFCFSAESRR
jgi:hypothetical protein